MNQINFLPASYFHQRRRRRRFLRDVCLLAAVVTLLALLAGGEYDELLALEQLAYTLESEGNVTRAQIRERTLLQSEHALLARRLAVQQQVSMPVSYSQMTATISRLMPVGVGLSELRCHTDRPQPQPARTDDGARPRRRNRDTTPDNVAPVVYIELTGLSPDDATIAEFVGRLSDHPLFEQVKMEYSRSTRAGRLIARKFRITFHVPLNRHYRVIAADAASPEGHDAD